MKKKFFITALFAFMLTLNAQVKVKPGIKAGINFSDISNPPSASTSTESTQDFYAGAFVNVRFTKLYALQPEVTYSKQGFKLSGIVNTTNIDKNIDLDYLSIALTNKFFFKKTGLHAILGPSFDIRVNNVPNYFNNFSFNEDNYSVVDFTLFAGIGIDLPFGLTIEARYKNGLIDIEGDNFNQNVKYSELKNNKIYQIGIAYTF